MTQLRRRQKESIIRETLKRVTTAGGGGGGTGAGVSSYNGRTGAVLPVVGDIVAHASTHNAGGSDAMAIDAVGAGSLRTLGVGANQATAGNDSRLSDARVPLAHAPTHKSGGTDSIKLDELAAPTDIVTLNADTAKHGLLPKLGGGTANFLRADGTWSPPGASSFVMATVELNLLAAPDARRSGHVQIAGLAGLTVGKPVLVRQASGPYTGKGTRYDEAEMDQLLVNGKVKDAATIDVYWESQHRVRGNFKFDYVVSG